MKRLSFFLALAVAASGLHAGAAENPSALQALRALQTRIGPEACQVLVAIYGEQGQDQPQEWTFLALNQQSPNLGQEFRVGSAGVVDKGPPPGLYPTEVPPGFVDSAQVLIDSPYAFDTLHQAALRARVGFNSVNYTLVARDFGHEPVWRLEPLDAKGRPVGQLDLSAKSGTIFRSVWYYWDDAAVGSAWQGPRIVDSLLPDASAGAGQIRLPADPGAPLAGPAPERAPVAEPVKEKEKGGIFSRLRRSNRPLFGSPASNNPPPPSPPVAPDVAPEAGVAVPVPPGGAANPTADVAPAVAPAAAPGTTGTAPAARVFPSNP